MIEVKISGLKVADYWSPTDGWNYDAIDSLAKELCDRYREAEAEQTVELFKNYIERMSILHEIDPFSIDYIRDQIEWMEIFKVDIVSGSHLETIEGKAAESIYRRYLELVGKYALQFKKPFTCKSLL